MHDLAGRGSREHHRHQFPERQRLLSVTCRFSTSRINNSPQITCAKPVPAGKEVEMCQLASPGDKMVQLTAGYAECTK